MRARRKGADSYSRIARVQLEDSDILYDPSVIEFESDATSTDSKPCPQTDEDKHWDKLRCQAAITVLPQCIATCNEVLMRGGALQEGSIVRQVSKMALQYADGLIAELKGE